MTGYLVLQYKPLPRLSQVERQPPRVIEVGMNNSLGVSHQTLYKLIKEGPPHQENA